MTRRLSAWFSSSVASRGWRQSLQGSATDLAVMRIVVAVVILGLSELHAAPGWALLLEGEDLFGLFPVDPLWARAAWWGTVLGSSLGLLGVVPRLGFALVAICGLYLLGIPHLRGGTIHYHHLWWFSVLLAVSPCGDALAYRASSPRAFSLAHGIPVKTAWLLIGLVFFFPGLHKVLEQGLFWDPTTLMYWKWAQSWSFTPLFRLDEYPLLIRLGGVAVVVFELGMVFAVWHRSSRMVMVTAAMVFHAATSAFFDIQFSSLWLCYFIFVPWSGTGRPPTAAPSAWRPGAFVSVLLTAGVVGFGVAGQTQGWPFACYPTFAQQVPRRMPALEITWVDEAGREHAVPIRTWTEAADAQRQWGEAWALMRAGDHRGMERLWGRIARRNGLDGAVEVRFYQSQLDVTPPTTLHRGRRVHVLDTSSRGAVH